MTSAIVLNVVGALVIVGGWSLAVLYVYRSLAADGRRRTVPADSGRGTVPADQDVEREYSLARSAR